MLNLCLSFILNRVNNVERRENNGGSLNFLDCTPGGDPNDELQNVIKGSRAVDLDLIFDINLWLLTKMQNLRLDNMIKIRVALRRP